jgi:hypothetical protein
MMRRLARLALFTALVAMPSLAALKPGDAALDEVTGAQPC